MVEKFNAEINKVYFINQYTLVIIESGSGSIQVDFKNYNDWEDKAIYLSKGQYIKFMSDDFKVRFIRFPNEQLFQSKDVRVLFKHLISLGYINFKDCEDCKRYLSDTVFSENISDIIDVSTEQWYWQNPFQANKNEYQVIFDIKDVIDEQYLNNINSEQLASIIAANGYNIHALVKNKLGITINTLIQQKKLTESKKDIAFTDKSIKEVAYDKGYNDPAYFNRLFKKQTGQTPQEFRHSFDFENRDLFIQNIVELIQLHHKEHHDLSFYANRMNTSVKTLSKKVKKKMSQSLGQLIRHEIIASAKQLLKESESVKDISHRLGFEEPNHFSAFFKHYTGKSPSEF